MDPDPHDALLKSVSRSFYLSLRYLPRPMREPLSLGYLLARFTDTIADTSHFAQETRLALLDEFRLVMMGRKETLAGDLEELTREIEHPGEQLLLQSSTELFSRYESLDDDLRSHLREVILSIIEGQSWDIRAFGAGTPVACGSGEDLLRYTYLVAGCVGEFWTRVGFATLGEKFAAPEKAPEMLVSGRKLGQALQLVNILRDLHEDLPAGRCYLPADELTAVGWSKGATLTSTEIAPVFNKWLGVCHHFLDESDAYVKAVRNFRVRCCTRLPQLLASETVERLRKAGAAEAMSRKVKISRADVSRSVGRAIFF